MTSSFHVGRFISKGKLRPLFQNNGFNFKLDKFSCLMNMNNRSNGSTTECGRASPRPRKLICSPDFNLGFEPSDFKRSEDHTFISFRHPGLNMSDLGSDGNPTTKGMMTMSSSANGVAAGIDCDYSMFAYNWINGDTNFSLNFQMKLSEVMYARDTVKTDLHCQVSCVYVGSTSLKFLTEFFVNGHSDPVMSAIEHFVKVDPSTRRPKLFPSWMLDKMKEKNENSLKSKIYKKMPRPHDTFIHFCHVTWSDTDSNNHCNYSSYAQFADNAIHAALRLRDSPKTKTAADHFIMMGSDPGLALRGITSQITQCGVKDLDITFFKECIDGERLAVHVWQDGIKDNKVFCSIERDDDVICQLVLEYFTPKSNL